MVRPASRVRTPRLGLEALEERTVLSGSPIGNLVVFGDSLNDVGNVSLATQGQLPPAQLLQGGQIVDGYFSTQLPGVPAPLTRFSGGPVWAESLSEAVGEGPVLPSLLGGNDFSFGGATLVAKPVFEGVPRVWQQVGLYLKIDPQTDLPTNLPASDDLFAFWAGANDFFASFNYDFVNPAVAVDAGDAADALADQVALLASLGGKRFLVNELPYLGNVPFFHDSGYQPWIDTANAWTTEFNDELLSRLNGLSAIPGTQIVTIDTNALFAEWTAPDAGFGFTNTTDAVGQYNLSGGGLLYNLTPGLTEADRDGYLFWDSVHPGARAHELLGLNAAAKVLDALDVDHLTVTTTSDALNPLDGGRSLREMLAVADLMPGRQTITFDLGAGAKTITLGGEQLSIHDDLTLVGPKAPLTISGAGKSRIFEVSAGANVSISALKLVNGDADQGGAIYNAGRLKLIAVSLVGNTAEQGGAIANVGGQADATLVGVLVASNKAAGATALGGGLATLGGAKMSVYDSLLVSNEADGGKGGNASGGAAYVGADSSLKLFATVVAGNSATEQGKGKGQGGGVFVAHDAVFQDCLSLIFGNKATGGGPNVYRD